MNTAELIYKIIQFFFENIWQYLGLLLLIFTIRGDVTKSFQGIKNFITKVIVRYKDKQKEIENFKTYKETISKKTLE